VAGVSNYNNVGIAHNTGRMEDIAIMPPVKYLLPEEVDSQWHSYIYWDKQELQARKGDSKHSTLYVWVACPKCGEELWKRCSNLRQGRRPWCPACALKYKNYSSGPDHYCWAGGISYNGQGYRLLHIATHIPPEDLWLVNPMRTANGFYVLEHRYVVASRLGRPLARGEVVRQLNGIKDDNRSENLVVGTNAENMADHNNARMLAMYWHDVANVLAERLVDLDEEPGELIWRAGLPSPESVELC